ncbi:MAG: 23S rRNA (adenine(2503)-C(2))-methyltransferase RlmN [Candidatus Omnitrophota bacterium]
MKKNINNFTFQELEILFKGKGQPRHRAEQVFSWLYNKNASSFSEMTNLPKALIQELDGEFVINKLTLEKRERSKDGTQKFLWKIGTDEYIESVFIKDKTRNTLCLSTQSGCKYKCPFCASGKSGFKRDLDVSEIVGQVTAVQELVKEKATNIVFMGMGEPLDNYDNLAGSIKIMNHKKGLGIGARKITVSTCGIVPGILKLKDLGIQIELSVSLHAASNVLRDELVPANRKYPLEELVPVCKKYYQQTGRIITLEYALIKDKNDSQKDAEGLSRIAKRISAKINLIPCNPYKWEPTSPVKVQRFKDRLRAQGNIVTVRRSRGKDILAACGQLAAGG